MCVKRFTITPMLHALERANERIAALEAAVARLARVTPRDGAWRDCYLALQADARLLVADDATRR
jgi:hypothetical protein